MTYAKKDLTIDQLKQSQNIVELLDKECLATICSQVVSGYTIDEDSRSEWIDLVGDAMAIALQKFEKKSTPWENASNIKFPLITRAGIDYASRTLPEIIQNDKVVKGAVIGSDKDDLKYQRAERVSKCMSYQLLVQSTDWEDGLDKLLQILPILGTVFKKTSYNAIEQRIVSELCVPDKIVVNYGVQNLESARRVTHLVTMYINDIIERQKLGIFNDEIEVKSLQPDNENSRDVDYPITLLEQHCYLDLDNDGYKEPYIVIVHKESMQVLRIVHRFKKIFKKDKKLIKIEPTQYFTDYHFIRSPDGGFYSMGFGTLLLPINSSINTLINQLIDSGTLANMQGGFIGRSLRIKNGQFSFKMGEWKVLDSVSGTNIGNQIFPLPTKEPSQVLFSLLGLLLQVGKDLTSSTDVLSGSQPAQNVSSSTISQLVEQGTKVFTAINKRVYRSLKKEYQKLYELDSEYLSQDEYMQILDDPEADVKKDFEMGSFDVHPVADPNISTDSQRMMRASLIQNLRTANPRAADILLLQSLHLDQDIIQKLLPEPDKNAPPPLEAQKIMMEIEKLKADALASQHQMSMIENQMALEIAKSEKAGQEADSRINESIARVWKMQQDALVNQTKLSIVEEKMKRQESLKEASLITKIDKDKADLVLRVTEDATKEQKNLLDHHAKMASINVKTDASPRHSYEDIQYTAKLKGMTVAKVKKQLGEN